MVISLEIPLREFMTQEDRGRNSVGALPSRRSVAEFLRAICRQGQGLLGVHGRHCSGERNTFEKTTALMERRSRNDRRIVPTPEGPFDDQTLSASCREPHQ